MARVLVTGGTGFVGANLVRRLIEDAHDVHLLVSPGWTRWRVAGLERRVTLHEASLVASGRLRAAVRRVKPDQVFHLAAYGAYSWQRDRARMVRANLFGTMALVSAALDAGCSAVVHAGSSSEYGFQPTAPGEDTAPAPNSDYAVTKAAATLFCRHMAQSHRSKIVTLRLYSVYGPYEDPRRFIPQLIRCGLEGRLPPLTSPDTARDFIHAADVVEAFVRVAQHPAAPIDAIYNVGTGVQLTLREVVQTARDVLAIRAPADWGKMPDRSWDTTNWVADCSRIRRDIGWRARYSFEQGFRTTIDWIREFDSGAGRPLRTQNTEVAAEEGRHGPNGGRRVR